MKRTTANEDDGERTGREGTLPRSPDDSRDEPETPQHDLVASPWGRESPALAGDLRRGNVVLGLGSGIDVLLTAQQVGPTGRVIGVELTDKMIERTRSRVAAAHLNYVEIRKGVSEDLPVTDESVDWVISSCVISLSRDKERVFDEMARALRPGGRVRIADVVAQRLPDWVQHSDGLRDSCVGGAISEQDYVAGLRLAGLSDITVGGRYVYDRVQLAELAGGARMSSADVNRVSDELVGCLWSVYFSARKALHQESETSAG